LNTLPRLLDSILAQSFKSLEVVLVDDCSEESCAPIVEAWRGKGLDITLLEHQRCVYTMRARLAGIQAARGEIVGFADADDILWGTEEMERNIGLFLEEKPDILHFRTVLVNAAGDLLTFSVKSDPQTAFLEGGDIFRAFVSLPSQLFFSGLSLWNKFFSKQLLSQVCSGCAGSRVVRHCEDGFIYLMSAFHSRKYIGTPYIGYAYYYDEAKKYEQAHERLVNYWHFLHDMTAYLESQGCANDLIDLCRHAITQQLCLSAGHAGIYAVRQESVDISDAMIERMLTHVDAKTFIKALLLGNYGNAEKIVGTLNAIFPKFKPVPRI
jgi:glycosyltransferase involved in cell wall biosynthesis